MYTQAYIYYTHKLACTHMQLPVLGWCLSQLANFSFRRERLAHNLSFHPMMQRINPSIWSLQHMESSAMGSFLWPRE